MKNKIIWLLTCVVMMASLLVTSCGNEPDTEETVVTPGETTPAEGQEPSQGSDYEAVSAETPKYGGIQTTVITRGDPGGFDPKVHTSLLLPTLDLTNDELLTGDWTKGPAGTGETDWQYGFLGRADVLTGSLAESWEMPDDETIIFHIRQGVHYWDKAPASGREFTAEDAAWNIREEWLAPSSYLASGNLPEDHLISAEATDRYTVELKVPPQVQGLHLFLNGERCYMMCPDVTEEFGSQDDWQNNLGTGPFMITDFVSGSQITYERNPNYWMDDPLHPGNQLPYIEGVQTLFIPMLPPGCPLQDRQDKHHGRTVVGRCGADPRYAPGRAVSPVIPPEPYPERPGRQGPPLQ
jgi:ABC-type transport system substrate-binding protein